MRAAPTIILCLLTSSVSAQEQPVRPIDQGYEDTDALRTSIRVEPIDLRRPAGFGQVYRVPGDPTAFSRTDGAVTAVFDRGAYVRTPQGVMPDIPAGTVFYIGGLPQHLREQETQQALLPNQIDRRVPADWKPEALVERNETLPRGHVLIDDAFRKRRVRILLRAAYLSEKRERD